MTRIAILTSNFPFPPGEQFLETEILHWGFSQHEVVILPLTSPGSPRPLPKNVTLDLTVARGRTTFRKLYFYVLSPFTSIFTDELRQLIIARKLRPSVIQSVLLSISRTLHISHDLGRFVREQGHIDLVYCYWNDIQS